MKTWLERLGREGPALLALNAPPVACDIDGILKQAVVAKDRGNQIGLLWFAVIDTESKLGYSIRNFPVELKHAITLIKTVKKRKS
jgi:hypothetical protein